MFNKKYLHYRLGNMMENVVIKEKKKTKQDDCDDFQIKEKENIS